MNNLKNKVIRGKQSIKRKMGKTQVTSDEEYEQLFHRAMQMETTTQNFAKHVQQLVENFHAFSSTLHFLAEDCRDLYLMVDRDQKDLTGKFMNLAEEMEKTCVIPFQEAAKTNVLGAAEQHLAKFSAIKDIDKKRKRKQLDFEYQRDRVQSLSSKQSSKNPMELPKAKEKLAHAKEEFDEITNGAKAAMQDLLEQRTEVFDPAVSSLLMELVDYKREMAAIVSRIERDAQHLKQTGGQRAPTGLSSPMSDSFSQLDINEDSPSLSSSSTSGSQRSSASFAPRGGQGSFPSTPSFNNIPLEYDCDWFYLDNDVQQQGPFGFLDMKKKYKSGDINTQTHVFGGEMADWSMIKDIPKFKASLEA